MAPVAALTASGGYNPFKRAWRFYERQLRQHPIATQSVSAALLWGAGDVLAQRLECAKSPGKPLDARRVLLTSAFAAGVVAPCGQAWYALLDRICLQYGAAGSASFLAAKVLIDNFTYNPLSVTAFLIYGCAVIEGMTPSELASKLQADWRPTVAAELVVWPPVMCAIFAKIPVRHQVLAASVVTLFDVAFLSWVRDNDGFAACEGAPSQPAQQPQREQRQPAQPSVKLQPRGQAGVAAGARQREQQQWQWCMADVSSPELTLGQMALASTSVRY